MQPAVAAPKIKKSIIRNMILGLFLATGETFFSVEILAEEVLSSLLPGTGMPAPPIGGVGDAIGAGWAIGGEEAREGSGDGEAAGVGPEDNAGGGVTAGVGVGG